MRVSSGRRVRYRDVVYAGFLHDMRMQAPRERDRIWEVIDVISPLSGSEKRRVQAAYMRAWRRDQWHSGRFYRNLSVGALGVVLFGYMCFIVVADRVGGESFYSSHSSLVYSVVVITGLVAVNGIFAVRYADGREFAGRRARRSDLLLESLIRIAGQAHTWRYSWWDERTCRRLRFRIDQAARQIQATGVRLRRTDVWVDRSLRTEIRTENRRVAETLRQHSRALAKAGNQADYERILESLRGGLLAAARDDWDALLENAPEINRATLVVRAFARLGPAVILLGTAALLPAMPGFSESADQIRKFLIPLGVLAALGASETVTNSVRGVLDKVAFGSK